MWVSEATIRGMFMEARRKFDAELWIKPNKDWQCGRQPTRQEIDEFLQDLEMKILKFRQPEAKTSVEIAAERLGEKVPGKKYEATNQKTPSVKERANQIKEKYRQAGYIPEE